LKPSRLRIFDGLSQRGHQRVFDTHDKIRRFTRSIPTIEVAISIKTSYHRNRTVRWTQNTTFDIDAMAGTVPYCHAVASDRQVIEALRAARIPETMTTDVISIVDELTRWLEVA
jgi:hypothetical protein